MNIKKFADHLSSRPLQLSLFELPDVNDKPFSQNVIYDLFPKYYWGRSQRIEGKFLNPLRRKFRLKGGDYYLEVYAAAITEKDGETRHYYLTQREEFVEDALRKMMVDGFGVYLDGAAGVKFTLYNLQQFLKKTGHSYTYVQIRQALQILNRVTIEFMSEKDEKSVAFHPIETLGFKNEDGETQTFVRFSSIVTEAINHGQFRLFNYDQVMRYKTVVARQFHKRLAMYFVQAGVDTSYSIKLSRIVADFGLTDLQYQSANWREIEIGIKELVKNKVIERFESRKIKESEISDRMISLFPTAEFIREMKLANQKVRNVKEFKAALASSELKREREDFGHLHAA